MAAGTGLGGSISQILEGGAPVDDFFPTSDGGVSLIPPPGASVSFDGSRAKWSWAEQWTGAVPERINAASRDGRRGGVDPAARGVGCGTDASPADDSRCGDPGAEGLGCGVDLSGADHGVGHNLGSGIDDDVQEVPSRDDNASAPISTEKKKR
jgi:hypothetical protein